MAKIVCTKNTRPGICDIGDIVSIHDDDVDLSGSGYSGFIVISVKGLTGNEIIQKFDESIPKTRCDIKNQRWEYEKESVWEEMKVYPKYLKNVSTLSAGDLVGLEGTILPKTEKLALLEKVRDNIIEKNTK